MNRRGSRGLIDALHGHFHLAFGKSRDCRESDRARAVGDRDGVPGGDAAHVGVMRDTLAERRRRTDRQRRVGVEAGYRGAIVALHQVSSLSSSTTRHSVESAESIASRSEERIPLKIARPSSASAVRITGNSSSKTDEMMFAVMRFTGAINATSDAASPSMTLTRSDTWFRATFSVALPIASGSISIAAT